MGLSYIIFISQITNNLWGIPGTTASWLCDTWCHEWPLAFCMVVHFFRNYEFMAAGLKTYLGKVNFIPLYTYISFKQLSIYNYQYAHLPLIYICQWTESSLVQVMACRLSAPSYYLNQCWLIVNWTPGNIFLWYLNQNSIIFIKKNAVENVACLNVGHFVQEEMSLICFNCTYYFHTPKISIEYFHPNRIWLLQ